MKMSLAIAMLLVFGATQVEAGDIAPSTLSSIGLSDMQTMSDAEAQTVRAKGFVFGRSTVRSGGIFNFATSTNGYASQADGFSPFVGLFGANFSIANVQGPAPIATAGGFSFTNR